MVNRFQFFFFFFSLFVNSKRKIARFDMRGTFLDQVDVETVSDKWEILRKLDTLNDSKVGLLIRQLKPKYTYIFSYQN